MTVAKRKRKSMKNEIFIPTVIFCLTASTAFATGSGTSDPLPYYGDVSVTATGIKEGDETSTPREMKGEVFINGIRVGVTPYEDGLPEGTYTIEVRQKKHAPKARRVTVVPGETHKVDLRFKIPLTKAERDERLQKAWEAQQKEQEELERRWRIEHAEWEDVARPLQKQR